MGAVLSIPLLNCANARLGLPISSRRKASNRAIEFACLLPRIPELLVVALGVWRAGAVYVPLFTAFGGKAIEHRLERSAARLIVTDTTNRPKLNDLEHLPPVMTLRRESGQVIPPGDFDFQAEMARHEADFPPVSPHRRRSLYLHARRPARPAYPRGWRCR